MNPLPLFSSPRIKYFWNYLFILKRQKIWKFPSASYQCRASIRVPANMKGCYHGGTKTDSGAVGRKSVSIRTNQGFAGSLDESMRPASPMVRRKRDFFEWEFTKKMNAVGLWWPPDGISLFISMRPASPMVRRKRDFFEWEFTKKMNAVGLWWPPDSILSS